MKEQTKKYLEIIPEAPMEIIENSEPYKPEEGAREMHLFAMKNTICKKNSKIYAQWQTSFARACRCAATNSIEYGAVLDINEVGKCSDTGAIVMDYTLL